MPDGHLRNSSRLNDNTQDENTSSNKDTIFSRGRLGHESRDHSSKPCSKFEDRSQPSFARLILRSGAIVISHMLLERRHGEDTTEYSLIVAYGMLVFCRTLAIGMHTIKQSSNASKKSNTENSEILHQCCWPTLAHQCLATLERRIVDARSCISCDHLENYEFLTGIIILSRNMLQRN